jgi:hypothetical protein
VSDETPLEVSTSDVDHHKTTSRPRPVHERVYPGTFDEHLDQEPVERERTAESRLG